MKIINCDRCGENLEIESNSIFETAYGVIFRSPNSRVEMDLCNKCWNYLHKEVSNYERKSN